MKNWKKVLGLTAAVAMTATMMPTAVFADDADTFKVGVIGPMTGDYAQYGLGVYHAAQVAAEEINANGGFNGYNGEILDAGGKSSKCLQGPSGQRNADALRYSNIRFMYRCRCRSSREHIHVYTICNSN